jgi:hypothetical protein
MHQPRKSTAKKTPASKSKKQSAPKKSPKKSPKMRTSGATSQQAQKSVYKCKSQDGNVVVNEVLLDKLHEKYPCFGKLPPVERQQLVCWFGSFANAYAKKSKIDLAKIILAAPGELLRKARCGK